MVARAVPQRNPERIAWTVLLSAFFTFVALVAGAAISGRYWLRQGARAQVISMVPSGIVQVTQPGRTTPEVNLQSIPVGSVIATETNAQASLTFARADSAQVLASMQVFGDTKLRVEQADSPRFTTGVNPHRIHLHIASGHVTVYVGVDLDRAVEIQVESESGATATLAAPGSIASIESSFTDTMVTVREGTAQVASMGTAVPLAKDERAEVVAGSPPLGPLPAERNLVSNGDFGKELDGNWRLDIRPPVDPAEAPGTAEVSTIGGRRTVVFQRSDAVNWGQAGIVQDIDRDVRGYDSLRLHMDVMITEQTLKNCGVRGTECPVMVRLTYVDVFGNTQEWLRGFFFYYDPNPAAGATYCVTCWPVQWPHDQWPKGKWQVFDSDNLLEIFRTNNTPAAMIRSIAIYGSGWSFSGYVTNVQLLAE